MGMEIVSQVQEAQRVSYRINPRRNMSRHINQTIKNYIQRKKYLKVLKILKAAREIQQITYKGIPMRITADLSEKLCKLEGRGRTYLK